MDMDQIVRELLEAASEEGTETGECWAGLCDAWTGGCQYASAAFRGMLENEIREQHTWMKDNFTWVEEEAIRCETCGKGRPAYKRLVWNEELF